MRLICAQCGIEASDLRDHLGDAVEFSFDQGSDGQTYCQGCL